MSFYCMLCVYWFLVLPEISESIVFSYRPRYFFFPSGYLVGAYLISWLMTEEPWI